MIPLVETVDRPEDYSFPPFLNQTFRMPLKVLFLIILGAIASTGQVDPNGMGINDGRESNYNEDCRGHYEDKEYRHYGELDFKCALQDYTSQVQGVEKTALQHAWASGVCYCWVKKKEHPTLKSDYPWWGVFWDKYRAEAKNGALADRIQEASARCQEVINGARNAEEVSLDQIAMGIADVTLCPTGYPNPITQSPGQVGAGTETHLGGSVQNSHGTEGKVEQQNQKSSGPKMLQSYVFSLSSVLLFICGLVFGGPKLRAGLAGVWAVLVGYALFFEWVKRSQERDSTLDSFLIALAMAVIAVFVMETYKDFAKEFASPDHSSKTKTGPDFSPKTLIVTFLLIGIVELFVGAVHELVPLRDTAKRALELVVQSGSLAENEATLIAIAAIWMITAGMLAYALAHAVLEATDEELRKPWFAIRSTWNTLQNCFLFVLLWVVIQRITHLISEVRNNPNAFERDIFYILEPPYAGVHNSDNPWFRTFCSNAVLDIFRAISGLPTRLVAGLLIACVVLIVISWYLRKRKFLYWTFVVLMVMTVPFFVIFLSFLFTVDVMGLYGLLAVIFFAIAWMVPCLVLGIVVWMLTASENQYKTWSNFSLAAAAVLLLLSLFRGLLAQVPERVWAIMMLGVAVLLIVGGILFRRANKAVPAGAQNPESQSVEALWVFVALACSTAICAGSALTTQVGVLGISSNLNLINETGSARRYLVISKYCAAEFKQFALLALLPDTPRGLPLWFLPKTSRLTETNTLITQNHQKLTVLCEEVSHRGERSSQSAVTSKLCPEADASNLHPDAAAPSTLNPENETSSESVKEAQALEYTLQSSEQFLQDPNTVTGGIYQSLNCIDSLYCDPVLDEIQGRRYLESILQRRKYQYCKYAALAGLTETSCAETVGTPLPEKPESTVPPHNRQLELQLAIAASLGFWVPVGLLGAIQYRRDHGPSRSPRIPAQGE